MKISLIVALASNNGIGKDNDLLWHIPEDMKYFRDTTMGHHILTGRKNYISIPQKFRPLKGRPNLVVTHNTSFKEEGIEVFYSITDAIQYAKDKGEKELFIIGGGEIYKQTIDLADKLYITRVETSPEADTYFPEIDANKWKIKSNKKIENAQFDLDFQVWERI